MRKSVLITALVAACILVGWGTHSLTKEPSAGQLKFRTSVGVQAHSPLFGLPPKNAALRPLQLSARAVPTLEQFDTVTVSTVPSNPSAVAGYTSGFWPTFGPLVQAFPRAKHVSIAINVNHRADCLDIEPGDASPGQAAGWVRADRAMVARPCLYSSLSEMSSVNANLRANGIPRSSVREWDADWTYRAHLDAGFDCTQWTDHAFGRNLDESTCALSFYGAVVPAGVRCFGPGARVHDKRCSSIRPRVARLTRERDRRNGEIVRLRRVLVKYGCRDRRGRRGPNHDKPVCEHPFQLGTRDHQRVDAISVFTRRAVSATY